MFLFFILSLLAANWQATGKTWGDGDFTYDGNVNINDLSLMAGNWQAGVSGGGISFSDALTQVGLSGAGIPESGTLALLVGAGALALRRRGRGYENDERAGRKAREGRK